MKPTLPILALAVLAAAALELFVLQWMTPLVSAAKRAPSCGWPER